MVVVEGTSGSWGYGLRQCRHPTSLKLSDAEDSSSTSSSAREQRLNATISMYFLKLYLNTHFSYAMGMMAKALMHLWQATSTASQAQRSFKDASAIKITHLCYTLHRFHTPGLKIKCKPAIADLFENASCLAVTHI